MTFARSSCLAAALALILVLAPAAFGQRDTGTIVGTVTDPSGAVVPGVTVVLRNVDTNASFQTVTDATGNYAAPLLKPGNYEVTAELPGFKKQSKSGIDLKVQDRLKVDFTLQVGNVTETVEVIGAAPKTQTEASSLGHVVDSKTITELPLNGRNFARLAAIVPGVIPAGSDDRTGSAGSLSLVVGGNFSANGVRSNGQNNFLLDGIDNNVNVIDFLNGSAFVVGPSVDAIQEFKIQTNAFSAEFGRGAGGVVNATIKSGTNAFHGSAFEYLRNSSLDSRGFFDAAKNPFKMNQFGGTLGGPIIKDRTFFFGDFQGFRSRELRTRFGTVPSTAMKNGNFSELSQVIYDPGVNGEIRANRPAFAGNIIPTSRFDPLGKKISDLIPSPNDGADTYRANNYRSVNNHADNLDQWDVRVDHKFGDKDAVFARYGQSEQDIHLPPLFSGFADGGGFFSGSQFNNGRSAVLNWNHIFTPRLINEARVGFTRLHTGRFSKDENTNVAQSIGFPGVNFEPGIGGLPYIDTGGSDLSQLGAPEWLPSDEFSNVWTVLESLSVIRGRHTLKMGFEYRHIEFPFLQPPYPRGSVGFNRDFTKNVETGAGGFTAADLLLGFANTARMSNVKYIGSQRRSYNTYFQDDWKVSSKLTLNLGLRYELVSPIGEKYGAQSNFNMTTNTLDIPEGRNDALPDVFPKEIAVNRTVSKWLIPWDKNNFAPRVGFAYAFSPKMVVRSAYGIFFGGEEPQGGNPNRGYNLPFSVVAFLNKANAFTPLDLMPHLSAGFPRDMLTRPSSPQLREADPATRISYVGQWNFTFQREIPFNSTIEVGYIGSKGTKLIFLWDRNLPSHSPDPSASVPARRRYPFLNTSLISASGIGNSVYHGTFIKLERRFAKGFQFMTSYTFGKALNDTGHTLGSSGQSFRDINNRALERGFAEFDIPHRFITSWNWELPWAKNLTGVAKAFVGGWQTTGAFWRQSGYPFSITSSVRNCGCPGTVRPDPAAGVDPIFASDRVTKEIYLNTAAFLAPAAGTFGKIGQSYLHGPGWTQVDMSVFKNFAITEHQRVQFRSEFFNLTNTAAFQNPASSWGSSTFGRISDTRNRGRQIQFALRYMF
jgi:hypothetical protein